ncbi:hypothetical protein [Nocardia acidivorans]|uniref:hypothetical protein n=1 Tax=Nocardia acidivorans TaxID=404580 RepID=UPI000A803898|nr:hypothetical protein [Nocardia acidivorans]
MPGGIAAVSMRSVSRVLGGDAKSLYHHIDGKDRDREFEYTLDLIVRIVTAYGA